MIKGAQKKMIVLRTHNSRMFEEAYFVMRHDAEDNQDVGDILGEANRIIEGSLEDWPSEKPKKNPLRHRVRCWLMFLAGVVCGGGIVGAIWWGLS